MNGMFDRMHASLFHRLAVPVTVQRGGGALPVAGRCIEQKGVERIGEYGKVIGLVTRLSFLKCEWDPARGDVVTFADNSAQTVEAIESDDGQVVQAVMHG